MAINSYRDGDLDLFDEEQTAPNHEFRRVFINICDEDEHVKTMVALQKPEARLIFKSLRAVFEAIATNAHKID